MVELAVTGGGDITAVDAIGNTPLHYAARNGLNGVVEFLVDRGADVATRNRRQLTPAAVAETPRRNRGGDLFEGYLETAALLCRLAARK